MTSSRPKAFDGRAKVVRDYRTRRMAYYERVNGRYLDPGGNVPLLQWSKYWEWVNGFSGAATYARHDDPGVPQAAQPVVHHSDASHERE